MDARVSLRIGVGAVSACVLASTTVSRAQGPTAVQVAGVTTVIHSGAGDQSGARIDGDYIVYQDDSASSSVVRYDNLATGLTGAIPNSGAYWDQSPVISGDTVAFVRSSATAELWTYRLSTGTASKLAVSSSGPTGVLNQLGIGTSTIASIEFLHPGGGPGVTQLYVQ